jgi:hypothetical protein
MKDLSDAIFKATKKVTRKWAEQRKAEDRGRKSRSSRVYMYSDRVDFTDVCDSILPGAYDHASGNGTYSVSKRQLYYASRQSFKDHTGRELEYSYFANTLLPQYLNRHPVTTVTWKITADPRGTLMIPNAAYEARVPVGTLQIENHLHNTGQKNEAFDDLEDIGVHIEWPSLAAGQRYRAVLYIEKEGFGPILQEAQIAERFSIAIMSCKGQSVVAARRFVDEVCAVGRGVPLLVIHDFDKPGFEISQRLTTVSRWLEDTDKVKYRFKNKIDVHDLGLKLTDVQKYHLEDKAEECDFKGRFYSDSIATPEEREFLKSGRRVELNAMTSPEFVEWFEDKLTEKFPDPFIPDDDAVVVDAYRRALAAARINQAIEDARQIAIEQAESADIPPRLRELLQLKMEGLEEPWDKVLYKMAQQEIEDEDDAA